MNSLMCSDKDDENNPMLFIQILYLELPLTNSTSY